VASWGHGVYKGGKLGLWRRSLSPKDEVVCFPILSCHLGVSCLLKMTMKEDILHYITFKKQYNNIFVQRFSLNED